MLFKTKESLQHLFQSCQIEPEINSRVQIYSQFLLSEPAFALALVHQLQSPHVHLIPADQAINSGKEAVESIMNLPRRFGTEDIIFGPKVSLIIVGIEYLNDEQSAHKLAKDIIRDVSAFDQRGCNSPHTIFIEKGGDPESVIGT